MISKNWLFSVIFLCMLFPGMLLSAEWIKFIDELAALCLMLIACLDVMTGDWKNLRRLRSLGVIMALGLFYVIYSMLVVHSNTTVAIIVDFVSQIKPFAVLFVVLGLGLQLPPKLFPVAKALCVANVLAMIFFFIWGRGKLDLPFGHIAHLGAICLLSSLVWLYCSIDEKGRIGEKDRLIVLLILSVGLLCGRSKFFGEFIIVSFLVFFYRPGLFRSISIGRLCLFFSLILLVIAVAWQKISYYFISGATEMIASGGVEEMSESYARPIMYYTGGEILLDYFPFGSGLASFASNASATYYSNLYYEYGLNRIWGLSPSYPSFIVDAYYPTLCQFGIVGVVLFFVLWYRIMSRFNRCDRQMGDVFKYYYVIGLSLLAFILIESIGGTLFIQGEGVLTMMMFALLLCKCNSYNHNPTLHEEVH